MSCTIARCMAGPEGPLFGQPTACGSVTPAAGAVFRSSASPRKQAARISAVRRRAGEEKIARPLMSRVERRHQAVTEATARIRQVGWCRTGRRLAGVQSPLGSRATASGQLAPPKYARATYASVRNSLRLSHFLHLNPRKFLAFRCRC